MILYLDTSALVKLYAQEDGSGLVRAAARQAQVVACHDIGYVEARAAFARKRREGLVTHEDFSRCQSKLDSDWEQFHVVGVTVHLLRRAADLADEYGLRAYDSIHLAAAESVKRVAGTGVDFRFAVFDGGLHRAAVQLGMPLLD